MISRKRRPFMAPAFTQQAGQRPAGAPLWAEAASRGSRRLLVVVGAVVLVALGTMVPAAAVPTDDKSVTGSTPRWLTEPTTQAPGFRTWAELFAYQRRLNNVAAEIAAVDPENPGIVANPSSHQLRVYWHGSVPESVKDIVRHADIPVEVISADYRHGDLVDEARRLAADPNLAEVGPRSDGSGLDVRVFAQPSGAKTDLIHTARVPVRVTVSGERVTATGRPADTSPYWGGSRFIPDIGGICSNGFAVNFPGQSNHYMITAAHCGRENGGVTIPGQPSPTGIMGFRPVCRDTALINYPNGVQGAIYNGPWNSNNGVAVAGAVPDFEGNIVLTGGASSGEQIGQVFGVDTFTAVGNIPCGAVGPLDIADSLSGGCIVTGGDSGGPVYNYYTSVSVAGIGTITGGLNLVGCGNPVSPDACTIGPCFGFSRVFYAPLLRPYGGINGGSLNYYGIGLLT